MDILLKMLAVLTLIWGGWMYFKSSDGEVELKKVRNELKVAKQELGDARAAYDAEDKKRESLAEQINTLKGNAQELRKEIAAKREEKIQRAAQERRDRLEAEKKARREEEEKEHEHRMALLEREKQLEKEEAERLEAKAKEEEAKINEEKAKQKAERNALAAARKAESLKETLRGTIESSTRTITTNHIISPPSVRIKGNDFGQTEKIKNNWSFYVQKCIESVKRGDSESFELHGQKLLALAKSISSMSGGVNASCISDVTEFIDEGRKIFEAKKQLKKLEKSKESKS